MSLRPSIPLFLLVVAWASAASAQTPTNTTETGQAPADAAAMVSQQSADKPPEITKPVDGTSATVSAGGQSATGNAKLLAATANGTFDLRRGMHGFGAALLANYAEGAHPDEPVQRTTQNVQGRLRYDLYFIDDMSGFLIVTGRNDYFQGLDFRLNLDPGVKYLFLNDPEKKFWGEAGYDFQHQINNNDARVLMDSDGKPIPLAHVPTTYVLPKTQDDHSIRLFGGFKYAFNKEVTLATGIEYLQSVVASERYRVNFDALIAANLGAGFSIGLGFTARYDHHPLPGKETLDTATTLSLIYGFSDIPTAAKPVVPCEPPPPQPAPPPEAIPPANGIAPPAPAPEPLPPPSPPPPADAPPNN